MKKKIRRYSLAEKNKVYDYWKKHGCSYRELAEVFKLPSYQSAAGIVEWVETHRRREKEKSGTIRFHERVADKTFLIIRPGWCWPENIKVLHEHTGQGVRKENAPAG